jgi:hypothetical protein
MPRDNGLKLMIRQLARTLAEYDERSAIFIDVRIFDHGTPQEQLVQDWDILHDQPYGGDERHRLKIGRMPKGVPHG